ncbi:hypothetical protein SEA_DALLAS_204 [Mycobacterium phage Dallas]|uniref:Uncharacterized protein n=1 Tax=Mycobacterium phage Baka TaxID=2902882 RepID=G1D0H0_9CAUD|nr:hypothetical protein FGG20_gp220 [Mycobacterium phage Baka]AEK08265.1 hypothetical protein PBI_BAKA_213 [Mycobacterium phage Baka]AWH14015.1 hypothetical protein SEA_HALLEY_207 [Mycobacterium phage Halley]AYB69692.1 hypothetical protein SEA_KALAH2_206 [Mycobacterium phage Kalah2]QDP43947.1 hypothetical protein SEA_DALLAS_204 [Mycobacterium phage Dallas]
MTHRGRPIIRSNEAFIMVLCPAGHVVHGIRHQDWAGSLMEARTHDPHWIVECDGVI